MRPSAPRKTALIAVLLAATLTGTRAVGEEQAPSGNGDVDWFKFSIQQNYLPNIRGFYYLRLHGRNAAQWWRHDNAEDRYNYLYSSGELQEFSDTADAARQLVRKAYLYTNNHYSAKSVVNAVMLKEQLREPIEGDYPPEFVDAYPEMETHVRTRTRSLLRG